ncbi:MAG: hypothetical protein DID89_2727547161 [Candidatus Nitrotoga sp. CP45]|nr:MAG: hypothetical protein DID89_2727547161 [Candidatus Nitrotoga sp. CP45]
MRYTLAAKFPVNNGLTLALTINTGTDIKFSVGNPIEQDGMDLTPA